jgi:hypothetical protein
VRWLVATGVGVLAIASPALAAPPSVERATPGNAEYWNTAPAYNITAATPGEALTWSATGPNGATAGGSFAGAGSAELPATEGAWTLTAFPDATPADVTTVGLTVDTTAPVPGATLAGTPNAADWYRQLSLTPACSDGGSGIASCLVEPFGSLPGPTPQTAGVTAIDNAGNTNSAESPGFLFDNVIPGAGQPNEPTDADIVPAEPRFFWTPGSDAHSGVDRYELQVRVVDPSDPPYETIAVVEDTGGVGDYSAKRDPALRSDALPEREPLVWRVRTIDVAGNASVSPAFDLRIDSTVPPAPTITGGPIGPTRVSAPSFSWTGTEIKYLWDVFPAGSGTAVRSGGGDNVKSASIASLPDGDYTFRVVQVTPAGQRSSGAARAFKVDTAAPAPPGITVRPPFPVSGPATFAWATEPGAYSQWAVIGAGGVIVLGPSDTPMNSVTLPVLPQGAYSFRVVQVDAAGNVSQPTLEPFTVVASALSPAPGPTANASLVSLLPRQHAARLKPKAGKTLPTRRPVLQWTKGPRGTKLYNLQIFRVTKKRKLGTPVVKKVHSAFPRGLQYRAPKKLMTPGTCYVWRVWPFMGRQFTPKPLGVSNFCVASKKVLAKKAALAAAKRKAAAARRR